MMPWTIENHNDVGPDPENECFVEWWTVTDGEKEFKCDEEEDAQFLAGILNGMMDQKPTPGRKITLKEACEISQKIMEKAEHERSEQREEETPEPTPGLVELAERLAESHGWRKDGKWVACTYPASRKAELDLVCTILNSPSVPSPGLVEAAREILPRLEAIIADGPDCGCEDLGHVCGWREFVVEVGHLRSALASCQAEPPHPGLIEAAKETLKLIERYTRQDYYRWIYESPDGFARDPCEHAVKAKEILRSAIAKCGEWERVTGETKTQGGTAEALEALHNLTPEEFLRVLGKLWPGAEVWRKRGKKEEEG